MQAGEKLNFIQSPDQLASQNKEQEQGVQSFISLFRGLLDRFPEAVVEHGVDAEDDILRAFEMPLRIQANDKSYLHVLVFGHSVPGGVVDFGINITEHDEDAVLKTGYIYTYDLDGFMRQKISPVGEENDLPDKSHFSLINEHRANKQLQEEENSDDIMLRMQAMETRRSLDEAAEFDEWEIEMGFDGVIPLKDEIFHLCELLNLAEPYTPPSN